MYSPLAEAAAARVGRGSKVTVTGVLREIIAQSLGVLAPRGASQQQDSAFDGAPSAAPPPPQQQQAPFYGQQGQQQQWAQQEQQQQQQQQQWAQQAAPGPTPPQAPASEVEAHWLSVLNEPNKWWDNRTNKRNPKAPDYKSKDGDIALWIDSRATPEWVLSNLPPTQG
ncbi:hypothetical protein MNEG_6510 [Monoraphidium neglectum]|uniref:Uncharacterized protein n=1 Tax=Monoraphidium neglectum TaxID=145388 RepID=A0A0D2ME54_9CHLO|nr:hypothetical protein MNEG_6510 [Monoraphidium neglectum]KIZ01455.1 hypothetical protein MNEG_6510 [Monoraphidium neglectum]|eukprot:XP_013900474.1 hypothetical protein MNEG_6510 [Monoraphidium neglectum]